MSMSVLIKGIEMPENCWDCSLLNASSCPCKNYSSALEYTTSRHPDCPLIHIPPHGRLIDADALVEDLKRQCEEVFKIDAVSPDDFWITRDQAYNERLWKTWCESFFEYLKTRETIIPASKEG
jgi:hypothetical protein